ncbi:MAG: FHA domain-containing protein [Bdellovibrionales bacterium]|nr:FHA domain-containing protein [Bdellovibrionales bacterium]
MKIEVTNGQKKETYSLPNTRSVIVGRRSDADVKLEGNNISREHLHILYEEGKAFFVDSGSTSGVFINKDKVTAFQKIEFNKFYPIQVGDYFISLISLDDGNDNLIPLKLELDFKDHSRSFKNYKAKAISKKRREKEEPKTSNLTILLIVMILAGIAFYYTKLHQ